MTTTFKPETRCSRIRVPNPRPRCSECGVGIVASRGKNATCIVVNRYEDEEWKETLNIHESCYRGQYGTPTVSPKRTGHRVMGQ